MQKDFYEFGNNMIEIIVLNSEGTLIRVLADRLTLAEHSYG